MKERALRKGQRSKEEKITYPIESTHLSPSQLEIPWSCNGSSQSVGGNIPERGRGRERERKHVIVFNAEVVLLCFRNSLNNTPWQTKKRSSHKNRGTFEGERVRRTVLDQVVGNWAYRKPNFPLLLLLLLSVAVQIFLLPNPFLKFLTPS